MMYQSNSKNCEVAIVSDASGTRECGAFYHDKCFQLQWPKAICNDHISEL